MSLTPQFMDELKGRISLSGLIGRHIKLTRAGREHKACCPFHTEKSPSFYVNDEKQFYHCFGCGAHGDAISFLQENNNLPFMEAVEALATEAGMKVPKPDPKSAERAEARNVVMDINEMAAAFFTSQLYQNKNAQYLKYMQERGVSEDSMARFRVGYAPSDGSVFLKYLNEKGYGDDAMIEAGLAKKRDDGSVYAFFRERIMFPVTDNRGRIIAFGGRILPDHMRDNVNPDFTPPKYLNSPDTDAFNKRTVLYGLSLARAMVSKGHTALVVEGYTDVIAMHQAGFMGAVAPMGTAVTEEQVQGLWSVIGGDIKSPVFCFDGDNAGQKAAIRALDRLLPLLKAGQSARFAFMPQGEDPDSLIKGGGPKAMRSILEQSIDCHDMLWLKHTASRSFTTPEAQAGLMRDINADIALIPDGGVGASYKAVLKDRFFKTFRGGFNKKQNNNIASTPLLKPDAGSRRIICEAILVACIVEHPGLFDRVEDDFGAVEIENDDLNRMRQSIIQGLSEDHALDSESIKTHISGDVPEWKGILKRCDVALHASFITELAHDHQALYEAWLNVLNSLKRMRNGRKLKVGS